MLAIQLGLRVWPEMILIRYQDFAILRARSWMLAIMSQAWALSMVADHDGLREILGPRAAT